MTGKRLQIAFWLGLGLAARPAGAVEGRYQGSVSRVVGIQGGDAMRHLYEIGGRQTLPRGLDLQLRGVFRYQSQLPIRDTDLLRTRLLAELRATQWRVDAQYSPWQRNVLSRQLSRESQTLLGVHWTPARGPQVDGQYERLDREVAGVRSSYNDSRVRLGWERNSFGATTGLRRIDSSAQDGIGAPQRTDQWDGSVHAERRWGPVFTGAEYEGLVSKYGSRALRRTMDTQRVQGRAVWTPNRWVAANATLLDRWGGVTENTAVGSRRSGERGVTAGVNVRPVVGLSLQAMREYSRQTNPGLDLVVDHLQFLTIYQHDVWRQVRLQTGWMNAIQFAGATSEAPRNTVYALLDGRLRPGLDARTEVRASRVHEGTDAGTQWHELAEARTRPTRSTRLDATWTRESHPRLNGAGQTDYEWQVIGAYEPSPYLGVSGTWRRQTGSGRVHRDETVSGLNANWRPAQRTSVALNGQWRESATTNAVGSDRSIGLDVGYDLSDGTRTRMSARETRTPVGTHQRSYSLLVEKNF